jgi:hypothetical protein
MITIKEFFDGHYRQSTHSFVANDIDDQNGPFKENKQRILLT